MACAYSRRPAPLELNQLGAVHGSVRSYPNIVFGGPFTALMAGVYHPARFDQQQLHLAFRVRLVFDAFRNDEHFSLRNLDCTVAEIDAQVAVDYDERFIGILVIMPYEVALEIHELELIIVHFRNDSRRPMLGEQSEFLGKIDRFIAHARLPSSTAIVLRSTFKGIRLARCLNFGVSAAFSSHDVDEA